MAKHVLNRTRDTTWTINRTGDTWILGERGSIIGENIHGIFAPVTISTATVRVDGKIDVEGSNYYGVSLQSMQARIMIGETARVSGFYALNYENYNGSVNIDNNGLIEHIDVAARQGGAVIRNDGRIMGQVYVESAGAEIANNGLIKGRIRLYPGNATDPLEAENASHLVNSGKLVAEGTKAAIFANDVAVNIRNKGLLSGDIDMTIQAADDVVNNRGGVINGDVYVASGNDIISNRGGTINGNIFGYNGNDVFNMAGGRLNGIVYGGAGDDVVTLSSPATVYVEYSGQGDDTVRINGSYQLGANIEKLVLLGKGDHTGIGNSLENILTGNRGDNVLYGLGGIDYLYGGNGNDRLYGGDGADSLYGGTGRDILLGGADNDFLDGGSGNDTLTGGGGYDIFAFKAGNGRDTITDFENGADYIELEYYGFGAYSEVLALMEDVGGNVVITFSNADQLVILNATKAGLDPAFFEL